MEVLECIGFFLSSSWKFFTDITVPGFNFSFAQLLIGVFLAGLGLRFLFMILGTSIGSRELTLFKGKKDSDK